MQGRIMLLTAAAFVCSGGALHAQATLRIAADPVTHYIWRGIDMFDGGAPIQPSMLLELPRLGLSVGAWGSFSTVGRDRLVGAVPRSDLDELDLTVTLGREAGPIALGAGAIHYSFFANGFPDRATTTYEVFGSVGASTLPFAPTLTAFYDFNLGDGFYVSLGGEQSVLVGRPVDVSLGVGYMDQAYRPRVGFSDFNGGLGLPLELGPFAVVPSVRYTYAPRSGALASKGTLWGMLSVSTTRVVHR